jgi:cellulose synthase/poly-beta-1,6-N-acetylglucosamine synthase-like glycosyltransferase
MTAGLVLEALRLLSSGVLLAALAFLCLLAASQVWHCVAYVGLRAKGLAQESARLGRALPPDDRLPQVLVQVPTLNEDRVVQRIAEAIGRLDWPRDRLQIQILDDSTDADCAEMAREAVASLRSKGVDAVLLHRADRTGFKAAAMQAGLARSTDEYVAVFDADFVPPSDFLRRSMPAMIGDPALAFVQARWDASNADANALTRGQQRLIDLFFAVDAARCWADNFVIYHGSCAVWRRAAIDDLGGWQSDILSEDLDISLRAFLRGWSALALETVAVPGELPSTRTAWMNQQYRWTGGLAEAMRKYLLPVLRGNVTAARKLVVSLHLLNSLFGTAMVITGIAAALQLWLTGGVSPWAWGLAAVAVGETAVGVLGMALANQRLLRGARLLPELPRMLGGLAIFLYTQLAVVKSSLDALLGKVTVWLPTPKQGEYDPGPESMTHESQPAADTRRN